jgi:RimJ/RimL family protein N-acetyltransferase
MGLRPQRPRRTKPGDDAILELLCDGTTHVITTERLHLRHASADDLAALRDLVDDDVRRWQGWDGLADPALDPFFQPAAAFPLREVGALAIVQRESGELLGERTWAIVAGTTDLCATGSWLSGDARGKGYSTEELRAFTRFAHAHLGFARVWADTNVANERAIRQYRRAGFRQQTFGRDVTLANGAVVDAVSFEHVDQRARFACWPRT